MRPRPIIIKPLRLPVLACGLLSALLALALAGCSTSNVGNSQLPLFPPPAADPLSVSASAPGGLMNGQAADWSVSWTGGSGPFTVEWSFGGGADPDQVELTAAASPSLGTVVMQNDGDAPADFTYTVTVSDSAGDSDSATGSFSVEHTPAPAPQNFRLVLFHNNDGESQLVDAGSGELPDGGDLSSFGGAAFFKTKLDQLRAEAEDMLVDLPGAVVTVSSGDNFLAGAEFNASTQDGKFYDAVVLDRIGYSAICLGNHDFDFGPDVLADFIGEFSNDVPYLSCNLDFSGEPALNALVGSRLFKSTIVEQNGRKVGIIGATTELLPTISSPRNVDVNAVLPAVQAEVSTLQAAGANIIILISHLQDIDNELDVISDLRGVDVVVAGGGDELLANGSGAENLIPGDAPQAGRSYPILATDADGREVPVVTTPGEYRYIGRLVIDFDDSGRIASWAGNRRGSQVVDILSGLQRVANSNYPDAVPADAAIASQAIAPVEASIASLEANVIATSEVPLNGLRGTDTLVDLGIRNSETNLGNLDADCLLWQANQLAANFDAPLADIGFQNGGGIRNSSVIPAGDITELDTFAINAFPNYVCILEGVTVENLKQVLESSVRSYPDTSGGFLQVAGMAFYFDPAGTAWTVETPIAASRVKELWLSSGEQLIADGEIVDPARKVNIATIDFSARGGDSLPFAGEELHILGASYQQALLNYIVDGLGGTITAADYPEGGERRIQTPQTSGSVALSLLGHYETGLGEESNEIIAYDEHSRQLFSINTAAATLHVVDISSPASPAFVSEVTFHADYGPNSVAAKGGVLAVALGFDADKSMPGKVQLHDINNGLALLGSYTVGVLPDMVTFTSDGNKVLVACEGEPVDDYTVDPLGGVSIIDISAGADSGVVSNVDFTAFDSQRDVLMTAGVRIFGRKQPGDVLSEVSEDMEPEYITISPDNQTAWVMCQENNAVAVLDIAAAQFTEINPLGFKDWSAIPFDPSDDDGGINLGTWPVKSFYMPDAVASFQRGGKTWLLSANEGDARDYGGFSEEARIKDFTLDPVAFPDASLTDDDKLGRLNITVPYSDPDDDGVLEDIFAFGGRSFSIWDTSDFSLAFDSGDELEQITATEVPTFFNSDGFVGEFDARSDNKGPEPEGITLGFHRGQWYAFLALERVGGVMVYNVTDPAASSNVQYINPNADGAEDGDLGPEGIVFIPPHKSPNGAPLLLVGNEISGTTNIYSLGETP